MVQRRKEPRVEIRALKVHQWLDDWERVSFDEKDRRKRPIPHFYLFSIDAAVLRALTGIFRRTTEGGLLRSRDLGIQRRHEPERSHKIRDFIRYGFPWSELSEARRRSEQYGNLRKPGWLPTAVVVNVLTDRDKRGRQSVGKEDLIQVQDIDYGTAVIRLPVAINDLGWRPKQLSPLEVIDGQHRLWAFEDGVQEGTFELPVVAFHGLDISWQAYLFWTINITPKRINASLAYDLYPLLRTEDWLERFEGHSVYRETRAQELTEALWAHPQSAWYQKINMLGERGQVWVSQAAWIRSLLATYVKAWDSRRSSIGGLFGAKIGDDDEVLPWSRSQQAAFLILLGQLVRDAINGCTEEWACALRSWKQVEDTAKAADPAFYGTNTLLNTDQGIRGVLYVTNDLCYIRAKELRLGDWMPSDENGAASSEEAVSEALSSLAGQAAAEFLGEIAETLPTYDWRTSAAPNLSEEERTAKGSFRGSSGYRELRRQLLVHLAGAHGNVGEAATAVLKALGYK